LNRNFYRRSPAAARAAAGFLPCRDYFKQYEHFPLIMHEDFKTKSKGAGLLHRNWRFLCNKSPRL